MVSRSIKMYLEARVTFVAIFAFSFVATQFVSNDNPRPSAYDPGFLQKPYLKPHSGFYPSKPEPYEDPYVPVQKPYPPLPTNPPQTPPVSCSKHFRYIKLPDGQVQGLIKVHFNQPILSTRSVELHVNVSMLGYYGEEKLNLKLLSDPQKIVYEQDRDVYFQVLFPYQQSIPKITSIVFDKHRFCYADNFKPNHNHAVTNLYSYVEMYLKNE